MSTNLIKNEVKEQITKFLEKGVQENKKINFNQLTKEALKDKDTLEEYKFNLAQRFPNNAKVQFAINKSAIDTQIDTLPEVASEAFVRDNALLSRVDIREGTPNVNIPLVEWDEEKNAENLTEVQAGNLVDDVLRTGDTLTPMTKVQASFTITELASNFFNGVSTLDYQTRGNNRVLNKIIDNILYSGQGATGAKPLGTTRGIDNGYGVNGTGNTVGSIGAIKYATKALTETALGLSAPTDVYDLCYQVKAKLLPKFCSEAEEKDFVYVMNRTTWGAIKTVRDLNGRYLAYSSIDPLTSQPVQTIDGTPVVLHSNVEDNFVFLIAPKFYTLVLNGGVKSINDNGIVQLREGITTYVSRVFMDGSMNYGFRYKNGTAVTIGTTAFDNQNQNAFRYFKITA
jgi:hypothetical protein